MLLTIDGAEAPHIKADLAAHIENRLKQLGAGSATVDGYIVDNWIPDKHGRKLLTALQSLYSSKVVIALHSVDDCSQIAETFTDGELDPTAGFDRYFLLSLSRNRIRELVGRYLNDASHLDDEMVTRRVINDIDTLNIHRTPLNCLLLLKLAEQAFDENPVNRTEVIGRVLYLLFFQFSHIPTYASRPDLKDCEYALGFFSESLIREGRGSFRKIDFYSKVSEYCKKQLLQLDVDVLFAFLVSERIFVKKGDVFEFRFTYWLYYFAAHRMHHNPDFATYILSNKRYSSFPEVLEFYTGIDRRRTDAIAILKRDLGEMCDDFLKRTALSSDFNPLKDAKWNPDESALEALRKEVEEGLSSSAMPVAVKDALADANYSRAKPYYQELAKFMEESTLKQMVSAMRGAARALRNSDHVDPAAKAELLNEVVACWVRVAQILVVLSPVLAEQKSAAFEGLNFVLDHSFDHLETPDKRWHWIMTAIVPNVVRWYKDDIYSSKMGPLFANYLTNNTGGIGEVLVLVTLVMQRPIGWESEVEKFILREGKNSFYLSRVFAALRGEYLYGSSGERARQQLRRLAALAIAKHETGQKYPRQDLVERAAQVVLDNKELKKSSKFF